MNRKALALIPCLCLVPAGLAAEDTLETVGRLIESGSWQQARQEIDQSLGRPDLSFRDRQPWLFQREKMARIRLDFHKNRSQVLTEMQALVPAVTDQLLTKWEAERSVEFLNIDGQRWYFDRAAPNVFRVNPEARALWARHRTPPYSPVMVENARTIFGTYDRTGQSLNTPKKFRVTYTLTVKPGTVPAGETIRAWLPFPQSGGRQREVRLVSSDPPQPLRSPATSPVATVYLEKNAQDRQPTAFVITFEYTAMGFYQPIIPERVRPIDDHDLALAPSLAARPPHIVFDDDIKKLAQNIVGRETNPYQRARLIFQWIGDHIPWAGAREYSTIPSLSRYALEKRRGDCGIQTTLFITLCRLNGIPARWESGWITGLDKNMHDWCEIYLEPYGWVPADASFGQIRSPEERLRWFHLGNIDSYRLVVNTDCEQPLYPVKMHCRSEPVDFQRGEVEWRGGNLYYDQWSWDFHVEELPLNQAPKAE